MLATDPPRTLAMCTNELTEFGMDVEMDKQKVRLQYYVAEIGRRSALVAARLLPHDLSAVRGDVERIVRSLHVGK